MSLGATVSLLAAASLVVDYVLTVAVSLAAGAASLASLFPSLRHDIVAGLVRSHPAALAGTAEPVAVTEALGASLRIPLRRAGV
jgi:hypothetical protein